MDIVEIEGEPVAKRGKVSGARDVLVCPGCGDRSIRPLAAGAAPCEVCGTERTELMGSRRRRGTAVESRPEPGEVRDRVLEQLRAVEGFRPATSTGERD